MTHEEEQPLKDAGHEMGQRFGFLLSLKAQLSEDWETVEVAVPLASREVAERFATCVSRNTAENQLLRTALSEFARIPAEHLFLETGVARVGSHWLVVAVLSHVPALCTQE